VRDHLPAGVELLDARPQRAALQAPWPFNPPTLFADHILWSADFLPAGSYTLVYRVVPRFSGEFYALPARAWQDDFPEVQGASAGMRISIRPAP
jgi:hypothetical protein